MTGLTDFALLPPEINSGRMYSGAGSTTLLAAAAAWQALATELRTLALLRGSVMSELIDQWHGSASAAMAAADAPYATWMSATAIQAEQAATQAMAAAAAYETAFSATVPPLVIAANRAQLVALIATNFLGQNTPAIAATEAQYGEMWAQDAIAMYSYASESAAATVVTPFTSPPPTTNPAGHTLQADAIAETAGTSAATNTPAALSQLLSVVPTTLQGLASANSAASVSASSLSRWSGLAGADFSSPAGILDFFAGTDGSSVGAFLNNNLLNTIFSSGFYMPGNYVGTLADFAGGGGDTSSAGAEAAEGAEGAAAETESLASAVAPTGSVSTGGVASAALGHASTVGALSVPYGWTTAAPEIRFAAEALPGVGLGAATSGTQAGLLSEMALGSLAARAVGGATMGGQTTSVAAAQNRPLPIVIVRPPPPSGE